MNRESIIIERPDLQTLVQRYGYGTLTFVFWFAYLYLWLPLINLLAWAIEAYFFYDRMIVLEGFRELFAGVQYYFGVILLLFVLLIGWAVINYLRFRGLERRRPPEPVTTEDLARDFGVPVDLARAWQRSKSITIRYDAAGNIDWRPRKRGAEKR
jgi:biofilm PGA synthesis protein PgaD